MLGAVVWVVEDGSMRSHVRVDVDLVYQASYEMVNDLTLLIRDRCEATSLMGLASLSKHA